MSAPVPLPGISPTSVFDTIRRIEIDVSNLRGSGGNAIDKFNRYQTWANETAATLVRLVRPADVERLVTTPRYWLLQGLDPATRESASLASLVGVELDERTRAFEGARSELEQERDRWQARSGYLAVPDTTVYLHHDLLFDAIEWHTVLAARLEDVHLFIPLVVIDELDVHKRSQRNVKVSERVDETVRTRARVTLRRIEETLRFPSGMTTLHAAREELGGLTAEILPEPLGHVRLPSPDQEIVDRCVELSAASGRQVHLVTLDTGMRVRGRTAGLEVRKLE